MTRFAAAMKASTAEVISPMVATHQRRIGLSRNFLAKFSKLLVNDFDAIIKQFLAAGEDMRDVFVPFLGNLKKGFMLIGDVVAKTLGDSDKSGMRGIRYLLDTVTTLFFGNHS
jgi:hypothetical protein